MVKDPDFVASSTKAKLDVSFLDGASLQAMVADLTRVTPDAIARAKQLTERGQTDVNEVRK